MSVYTVLVDVSIVNDWGTTVVTHYRVTPETLQRLQSAGLTSLYGHVHEICWDEIPQDLMDEAVEVERERGHLGGERRLSTLGVERRDFGPFDEEE
jgi:hypothetical protein